MEDFPHYFTFLEYSVPSLTPPKLVVSRTGLLSPVTTPPTKEDRLERTILSMASLDLPIAIQSMNAIENVMKLSFYLFPRQR